jgi:hypothetical protein
MKNRISTRWPRDPLKCWKRAETNKDFVAVVVEIMYPIPLEEARVLDSIYSVAVKKTAEAREAMRN